MFQRFIGHDRPEIGAADPDIDNIANAFAGVAPPRAATHTIREFSHSVQH